MYTYGEPPDYIHYLCEAIGECTGLIPLRKYKDDRGLTKKERWAEIRGMFRDHKVILKMMEIEPRKLQPNNFYCLDQV